jgi:hypothetical protein
MYKAFFEYNESTNSNLYKNFISKITNAEDIYSPNLSISDSTTLGSDFKKIAIQLDILEDFTYELKSSFEAYKDALGTISSLAGSILGFFDKLNQSSALGQSTTKSADLLKVQTWKETEPFRMNFKFSLQTKTDPFIDVYLPAIILSSQTILSPISEATGGNTVFKTPGVNQQKIASANTTTNKITAKDRNTSSKVLDTFAILVRNVQPFSGTQTKKNKISDTEYVSDESILSDYNALMSIDYAFIETAKPTWSKERTESGIPLWCELELTIQSVFSANDEMFSFMYPDPPINPTIGDGLNTRINTAWGQQILGKVGNAAVSRTVNVFR